MLVFLVGLYFVLACHFPPHYMSEISRHLTVARIEFMEASKIMLHRNLDYNSYAHRSHPFVCHLSLFQDILEGGNLRAPLQELHQIIQTPIKACSSEESSQRHLLSTEGKSSIASSHLGGGEMEGSSTVIAQGDIPAQFTRVMGKGSYVVLPVI